MKIIIAGAGSVGSHLAHLLSRDHMSVTLIDANEEKLAKVGGDLDIMALPLDPTSLKGLKKAGAQYADLLIAVTPSEGTNITCAALAKQLGTRRTVARVDNYEYMQPDNTAVFQRIGVDVLIYPELLAAKEIADSAQFSWVRQLWEFGMGGDLVLLSVKMHDNNPVLDKEIRNEQNQLVGHTLKEIGQQHGHSFHVVAIKRGGETVMPHGDERILPRDMVFFMTTRDEIFTIRHLSGKDDYPQVRRALILGGGKLSVRADWALPEELDVKMLEPDLERCEVLGKLTRSRTLVINGESHDMSLLNDEGYGHLEAFVALTDNDEENILSCVSARRHGIRKTIAQIENLDYLDMAEQLDVGTVINKKTIAASYIYRMLLKSSVDNVKMLNVADADVAEFEVKDGSRVTRKPVMQLGLPRGVNIGGMVRDGRGQLVGGQTTLKAGDRVVVFCIGGTLKQLDRFFR